MTHCARSRMPFFLPHQAALALMPLSALGIAVSSLTEGCSSGDPHGAARRRSETVVSSHDIHGTGKLACACVVFLLFRLVPSGLAAASPWLALWFVSPLAAWLLNLSPRALERPFALAPSDARFLREIARRTWRYFDDLVTARDILSAPG